MKNTIEAAYNQLINSGPIGKTLTLQQAAEFAFSYASQFSPKQVSDEDGNASKLLESMLNAYVYNIDDDGHPRAYIADLIKLIEDVNSYISNTPPNKSQDITEARLSELHDIAKKYCYTLQDDTPTISRKGVELLLIEYSTLSRPDQDDAGDGKEAGRFAEWIKENRFIGRNYNTIGYMWVHETGGSSITTAGLYATFKQSTKKEG